MNNTISDRLKALRESYHYTQTYVANQLGISAAAYNHYESGTREPNVNTLTKLAKLYHLEDQILGIYTNRDNSKSFPEHYRINKFLDGIKEDQRKKYFLDINYESQTLYAFKSQIDALTEYFNTYEDYKNDILYRIITSKSYNEDEFCKFLVYAFLECNEINYTPQQVVKSYECLNYHDYKADGEIDECIFNIKEIKFEYKKNNNLSKKESRSKNLSGFNPYKWAQENQYFLVSNASQFCINKPYIIICPYNINNLPNLTCKRLSSTYTSFRALCRRMFLGMNDDIEVRKHDKNCPPLISLKAASQCISAVIFIDISMDSKNDDTWIFINPNAKNALPRYIADQFRIKLKAVIDDFTYDIY